MVSWGFVHLIFLKVFAPTINLLPISQQIVTKVHRKYTELFMTDDILFVKLITDTCTSI